VKFKGYYRILGVDPKATAEKIKAAYRKLARMYHPDVNKKAEAQQRFVELGEANEALKDPERRAAYDRLRAGGMREGQEIDGPPPRHEFDHAGRSEHGQNAHFSDFFQSLFGGRHGGFGNPPQEQGADIHYRMVVTLEECYHGGERQLKFQLPGQDHDDSAGSARAITVKIPKGTMPGSTLRLRGQGNSGVDIEHSGDLYLQVELAPHKLYQVSGRDLSLAVPITPWEAMLGAQMAVPTLGGTVNATIPAGAQGGQRLRLKGRGLPSDRPADPAGDQYLDLSIAMPTSASDKAHELYRELARESAFNPRTMFAI
jgi:curved DNA-binding protein